MSYTTGVPAMVGAMMMLNGTWTGKGVFNVEEMDPDPFLKALAKYGLPWEVQEVPAAAPEARELAATSGR